MTLDYETLESRAQMLEAENERLKELLREALWSYDWAWQGIDKLVCSKLAEPNLRRIEKLKRETEEALK